MDHLQRPNFSLRDRRVFHGGRARLLYELIGWQFRDAVHLRFMNYGYDGADPASAPDLLPDDETERYPAQLYDVVASQVPLGGARVLDAGCGRGGGASHVHRYLGPAETVGCDLARQAIVFCHRAHGHVAGLSFRQGDAMDLPFPAAHFDAVLNVESAHCYPDRARFFGEAFRVLRPGGNFLFTDFTPPRIAPAEEHDRIVAELARAGFPAPAATDITAGIVRGLDRDDARRTREIRAQFPRGTRTLARLWAGTKGSWIYRDFVEGRRAYLMYHTTRPGVASPQPAPVQSSSTSTKDMGTNPALTTLCSTPADLA